MKQIITVTLGFGIIVLGIPALGQSADQCPPELAQAKAHGVLALRPMDSLRAAVQYMTESKLRSLPVIDSECRVLGMVSRNDLMVAIEPEAV
ncbi:MAG TPA: CBS domain-containing protein [Candidatus Limnocylindria bacterium]|nr:CBS domain-containing protein [Candidatus Limnocylindria bacterium]